MDHGMQADALGQSVRAASVEWARAGIERRLRVLQDAGRQLAERERELLACLAADGLSERLARHYGGWIVHAGSPRLLELYARSLVRRIDSGAGAEILVRRPDGVVLLVLPANSATINSAPIFSILLPGNGLLVRAPEHAKGPRFLVEEILQPALRRGGLDPGVIAVVPGKSQEVLARFLPSTHVDTVVFFGNGVAGQSVAEQAMAHRKKAVLELEGSDNLVVWKDAPIDRAAESASSAWHFSTQPCPVPKHLLVHGAVFDELMAALVSRLPDHSRTVEADPVDGMLGPVGRMNQYLAALEEVRAVGEIRTGGYRMAADGSPDPAGRYVAPTLVALTADACLGQRLRCFEEEISFPLIPVVRFDGDDEAILAQMGELLARHPFGLRTSVWARSPEIIRRFTLEIGAVGLLLFNDEHAQTPFYASPWGGPKKSGGPSGESHLFWEKTSRLQAIGASQLSPEQLQAVLGALGSLDLER